MRVGCLDNTIRKILVNSLATRFSVEPKVARKHLPESVEQWGKLCHLEGGDIMHAHDIVHKCMDGRDASFVCVRVNYYQMFFESNLYIFADSMNNLWIKISVIKTVPKISSFKHSLGNFGTSLSSPFPKARSLKRMGLKMSVLRLFDKFVPFFPTLMGCHRFHPIHKTGLWTLLTLNPFNVLSAVLKTGDSGGWLTAVARWHMRYLLRRISEW